MGIAALAPPVHNAASCPVIATAMLDTKLANSTVCEPPMALGSRNCAAKWPTIAARFKLVFQ